MEEEGSGPIIVSDWVYKGLEAVRRSGLTNMLDLPRVADLCTMLGHPAAAGWVRRNKSMYARGIFRGFEAGSTGNSPESDSGSNADEGAEN